MSFLAGFLRNNHRPKEPLAMAVSSRDSNRIANILMDCEMIGGYIVKPTDRGGRGWKWVVDANSANGQPTGSPCSILSKRKQWEWPAVYDLIVTNACSRKIIIRGMKRDDRTTSFSAGPSPDIIQAKKFLSIAGVNTAVSNGSASLDTEMTVASGGELFYVYAETTLAGPTHTVTFERSSLASGNAAWNDGGDFDPGVKSRLYRAKWWIETSAGAIVDALWLGNADHSDRAGN